jgi:two-component system phosphate regulon sensor histidine kinase PhoR
VKKRLLWNICGYYVAILIISLTAVALVSAYTTRQSFMTQAEAALETSARLSALLLAPLITPLNEAGLQRACQEAGERSGTRITVILPRGRVIADSARDPATLDNHSDRVEVSKALAGEKGLAIRISPTLNERTLYVAVPLKTGPDTVAVVRAASSIAGMDKATKAITMRFALIAAIMAAAAVLTSYFVSRHIIRPLEEIKSWAQSLAGAKGAEKPSGSGNEIEILAESLRSLEAELRKRMAIELRRKNEMEALLSSISEAIVAVDGDERIIIINDEACRLLSCDPKLIAGRSIQEAVRNTDVYALVREAFDTERPSEREIVLSSKEQRWLHAKATLLRDEAGLKKGVVIAFNDITALKRLEQVRKDFVANVSHEIKTPLTAIKGFVETLQESGPEDEAQRAKFLSIIERQVGRLEALVDDLLTLSRIEQETSRSSLELRQERILDIISSAIQLCEPLAAEKGIAISLTCPEDLYLETDPSLMEQAVFNLLENAVKYSEKGKKVSVDAFLQDKELLIKVKDEGIGIAKEHLPRIFERFYRADKARSRESGGTGLGLAIVKHIVQAHGGRVAAESEIGKGSIFTISLPARSDKGQ